jgi:hypothetical protein
LLANILPHGGTPPDSLGGMNIRMAPLSFVPARRTAAFQPHRTRFNPRADILDEVVAGLLWMALDLPPDVSRPELESFAHQLVARIRFGANACAIESEIAFLQSEQLGRPANREAIHDLAGRVLSTVKAV